MPSTPNYGWPTPDDNDAIADGAQAIRDLGDAADETVKAAEVPVGGIIMWSGGTVPTGWALCNGSNGTPDLRDRFIVGTGGAYSTGNTGGQDEVTLTESEMPSHDHVVTRGTNSGDQTRFASSAFVTDVLTGISMGSGPIVPTGGGNAHENRPPYYALAFIMRIS